MLGGSESVVNEKLALVVFPTESPAVTSRVCVPSLQGAVSMSQGGEKFETYAPSRT